MVSGEGLHPSVKAKRVVCHPGGNRDVIDGPYAETKELVAGFCVWKVKDMDEAVAWARKCPDPMPGEQGVLELRPVFEAEDFGAEMTPELREKEDKMRAQVEAQQKS